MVLIEMKFPCGYKSKIQTGFIDAFMVDANLKTDGICPMHGKNCRRMK